MRPQAPKPWAPSACWPLPMDPVHSAAVSIAPLRPPGVWPPHQASQRPITAARPACANVGLPCSPIVRRAGHEFPLDVHLGVGSKLVCPELGHESHSAPLTSSHNGAVLLSTAHGRPALTRRPCSAEAGCGWEMKVDAARSGEAATTGPPGHDECQVMMNARSTNSQICAGTSAPAVHGTACSHPLV
jgi:hypothetical protein